MATRNSPLTHPARIGPHPHANGGLCCNRSADFIPTVFFDLKVYGAYNVPRTGGVILVSNHQSYLDSVLLATRLDRPLSYMARVETFNNRAFAWLIRALNAFPISQGAGDIGAIKEAIARLNAGHALAIFPEGSRSNDGRIKPLEKGVGLIVRRARVAVVPVVIVGSFEALWPKGRKFPVALSNSDPLRTADGGTLRKLTP